MMRLLLVILLFLSSAPAFAEWVAVSSIAQTGISVYVDPVTSHRKGNLVKMWHLLDFENVETVAGDSYLSSKTLYEYDCAKERMRQLGFTWFSGNMGNGKVVATNSHESKWTPVGPGKVAQVLWKLTCSKK
jgi:hypothetical protein